MFLLKNTYNGHHLHLLLQQYIAEFNPAGKIRDY